MKRLIRSTPKVNAPVLGLDIHKRLIVYCLLDRRGDVAEEGKIEATREALAALLDRVVRRTLAHVSLEACGLSLWAYDLLVARYGAARVHLAQPAKVLVIARSSEKNDRNDAWWLAHLAQEARMPEAYVPPTLYREVRIASRERMEAVRQRVRAATRLKAALAQMGVKLPRQSLDCEETREFLEPLAASTPGMRGEQLREGLAHYDVVTALRDRWAERLEALAGGLAEAKTLAMEIPGVGKTLAATIVGETGPIGRFHSAKALGRYTGLTPSDRSTGGRQVYGAITREGSPTLRWALIEAVTHCVRSREGPRGAVGAWVRARTRRLGRGKARAAAGRKLAEGIWRLLRLGECFDPAKAFGGVPPPLAPARPSRPG